MEYCSWRSKGIILHAWKVYSTSRHQTIECFGIFFTSIYYRCCKHASYLCTGDKDLFCSCLWSWRSKDTRKTGNYKNKQRHRGRNNTIQSPRNVHLCKAINTSGHVLLWVSIDLTSNWKKGMGRPWWVPNNSQAMRILPNTTWATFSNWCA